MMKRQGQAEASTASRRDAARDSAQRRQREKRPGPRQYFREVRDEMPPGRLAHAPRGPTTPRSSAPSC